MSGLRTGWGLEKSPSFITSPFTANKMKTFTTLLAGVGLVAAHGYVDNATIGGQFYQVSP